MKAPRFGEPRLDTRWALILILLASACGHDRPSAESPDMHARRDEAPHAAPAPSVPEEGARPTTPGTGRD